MTRFTDEQYAKAIDHLQCARTQLEPDGDGCHCCGDSGHQAFECGHNPLVAMAMCQGIVDRANAMHDIVHSLGDLDTILPDPGNQPTAAMALVILGRLHEFMHALSGACMYMGTQTGPARVVMP